MRGNPDKLYFEDSLVDFGLETMLNLNDC
jgi:hypothetical protein